MIIRPFKLIFLILSLALLFFTGFLGMQPFYPDALQELLIPVNNFIQSSTTVFIVYTVLMMLLPLLFVIFLLSDKVRKGESYTIKGPEGNSSISENSIVKSLISAVRTVPTVRKVNPVIRNEKNGLFVDLHLQVQLTQFVPNICEQVRKRAASTLNNVLGVDRVSRINVDIDDVKFPSPPLAEKMQDVKKHEQKEEKPSRLKEKKKESEPEPPARSEKKVEPGPFKPGFKKEEKKGYSPFPVVKEKASEEKKTSPELFPGPKSRDISKKPLFPSEKEDEDEKKK